MYALLNVFMGFVCFYSVLHPCKCSNKRFLICVVFVTSIKSVYCVVYLLLIYLVVFGVYWYLRYVIKRNNCVKLY